MNCPKLVKDVILLSTKQSPNISFMEEILFLVNKDLPKVGGIVRWLLKNGITFNVTEDLSSIGKNIKN